MEVPGPEARALDYFTLPRLLSWVSIPSPSRSTWEASRNRHFFRLINCKEYHCLTVSELFWVLVFFWGPYSQGSSDSR